jgi:hypothetical protein
MIHDRNVHLQPFLLVGFDVLGVMRNPRVDPYYFASGALSLHLFRVCCQSRKP